MEPTRRSFLAGLSLLAIAPVLAACGSEDSDTVSGSGSSGGAKSGGAESGALPVTIKHKFGSTEITQVPKRVVCVGLVEQDALLALGIVPVAVTKWFGEAPGCIFPWATDALGEGKLPTVLDATNGIPVEKVANQAPDLIIGLYSGMTKKEYDLLSQIAPTVAQPGEYLDYGTPWDESTLAIGQSVGQPKAAKTLVDDVNAQIDKAAADHPEFKGKQAAVVTPYEGLFIYGPQDPRGRLLAQLGFTFPPVLLKEQQKEFGWSISAERTTDLDELDVVVWLDLANADKAMTGLWQKTSPYKDAAFFDISDKNGAYYVGHSMITPLSIPYVLERYVPQLAAAVDDDPSTVPPTVKD